jgi:hypothetical protein
MNKQTIIEEIDNLIQLSGDLDNIYIKNRLRYVRKLLTTDWNESEDYMQQIKEVLNTEETMNNLNDLKL